MTPQSIRRAAKALRQHAAFAKALCCGIDGNVEWGTEEHTQKAKLAHDEMLDLARQLEQLAKERK